MVWPVPPLHGVALPTGLPVVPVAVGDGAPIIHTYQATHIVITTHQTRGIAGRDGASNPPTYQPTHSRYSHSLG